MTFLRRIGHGPQTLLASFTIGLLFACSASGQREATPADAPAAITSTNVLVIPILDKDGRHAEPMLLVPVTGRTWTNAPAANASRAGTNTSARTGANTNSAGGAFSEISNFDE